MTSPTLSYDAEARALYLRLSENEFAETLELSRSTNSMSIRMALQWASRS